MSRTITLAAIALLPFLLQAQNRTEKNTVTDADGNAYQTIKIGNQIWTVENLKTTRFNDGTPLPEVTKKTEWKNSAAPAYCWYDNNAGNKDRYGALYNWYAVNTRKLAPKGWRVPTDEEWAELWEYLITNGYNWDGEKRGNKVAKSMAAKTGWTIHSEPGAIGNASSTNNGSGFTAIAAGVRRKDGNFGSSGRSGRWWSSSQRDTSGAWYRGLSFDGANLYRSYYSKTCGFSVRLLRD